MTNPSDDGEHTSTLIGRLSIQDLQQNCPLQRREVGVGISLDSRLASSWIGDAELFQKMEEAQMKIKRDSESLLSTEDGPFAHFTSTVVFAASLYF